MARAKVSRKRFSISEISARRMSCRKCTAHIATLRVEVSTPATTWAVWARKRFSAAALMAAQMSPSTMAGFWVSKACRFVVYLPKALRPCNPGSHRTSIP
jgi:hypothetical protein